MCSVPLVRYRICYSIDFKICRSSNLMLNSFNNCKYSSLNVSVLWCRSRFLIIPVIYLYSSSFHSFLTRLCLFCTARPFGYVFVYKCLPRLTLYIAYLKARWLIFLFLATNIVSLKGQRTISSYLSKEFNHTASCFFLFHLIINL